MLFPILITIAICLSTFPVVWGLVARRISAKQELYARNNMDAIKAAAEAWRLAIDEDDSECFIRQSPEARTFSMDTADQADAMVNLN